MGNIGAIGVGESATPLLVSGGVALVGAGRAGIEINRNKKESRKCKLIIANNRSHEDVISK